MRLGFALSLFTLLWQAAGQTADAPRPLPRDFAFSRAMQGKPAPDQHVCAVLDADVFAHARPGLDDLRVFANRDGNPVEVAYVVTASGTTMPGNDEARVLNAGLKNGRVVFDLAMPARAYTMVNLQLDGEDFLATATVAGFKNLNDREGTALGSYTLFHLEGQHLGSNTVLPLAEVSFPFLHVELALAGVAGKPAPAVTVTSASVPPSREAQTLYTLVAQTTEIIQDKRRTVARFTLPAQVPVERVAFVLDPAFKGNFSRSVSVTAKPAAPSPPSNNADPYQPDLTERIAGDISRVHFTQGGEAVSQETLAFAAVLGSGAQKPILVEVAVENGDDRALGLQAVTLQMRERKVCFDAQAGDMALLYGNPTLNAPVYDYSRTFDATVATQTVRLSGEQQRATPPPHVAAKTFTELHPRLLWAALLAVVAGLGIVAFRSGRRVGTP